MRDPSQKPSALQQSIATFENGLDPDAATLQPAIFSSNGRIGRVRYLAYSLAMQTVAVLFFVLLAVAGIKLLSEDRVMRLLPALGLGLFVVLAASNLLLTRRRLNDLDRTGWLALLWLVPVVDIPFALYVLLWPGTPGHNNYGPKPVPNTLAVVFFALLPVLIGIIAGVAVWSYLQMPAGS